MPSLLLNAASPLDASDDSRLAFTGGSDGEVLSRALDDTPSVFESMVHAGSFIRVEYRVQNRVDDTIGIGIRIVNGATILAADDSLGSFIPIDNFVDNTTDTTTSFAMDVFGRYVNETATKTDWDGASVEIQQSYSASMSNDGAFLEVDYVEFEADYITNLPQVEVGGTITPSGSLTHPVTAIGSFPVTGMRGGPVVRESNGDLYAVALAEDDESILHLFKQAEADAPFWEFVGAFTHPTTSASSWGFGVSSIAITIDGDTLHATWLYLDSSLDGQQAWQTVDVTTDTFASSEVVAAATAINKLDAGIGVRSDGTPLVFYKGSDGHIHISRRIGTDSWSATEVEAAGNPLAMAMTLVGDDAHLFWIQTSDTVQHRVFKSNNTLSTIDQISGAENFTGGNSPSYAVASFGRLFYAQKTGDSNVDPIEISVHHSSGQVEDETWTTNIVDSNVENQANTAALGIVAAGNRVFAAWLDGTDNEVHYSEWNDATESWGIAEDSGVAAGDDYIWFAAYVDTSDDVHIAGFYGDPGAQVFADPAHFFDITVGPAASGEIVKVENEVVNLQEGSISDLINLIIKQEDEVLEQSEADLKVVEIAPTGHTGWGIPIGIP